MSPSVAMERQPAVKPQKVRIEKPEISVYQAPAAETSQDLTISRIYKVSLILSFIFSTAVFYLVLSSL